MRRPLGLVVVLSRLVVAMNNGVNPMVVRIATPLSMLVFELLPTGYIVVAAKSSDTCVSRHIPNNRSHIHGALRPSP